MRSYPRAMSLHRKREMLLVLFQLLPHGRHSCQPVPTLGWILGKSFRNICSSLFQPTGQRSASVTSVLEPSHLLTVFSTATGLSGAESRSALLICSALHTWELRLAHCKGVSPSLFFKVTSESRERNRLKWKIKWKSTKHPDLNLEETQLRHVK